MGKKIDLNQPATNSSNVQKHPRNYQSYSHTSPREKNDDDLSDAEKKIGQAVLQAYGVPKEAADMIINDPKAREATTRFITPKITKNLQKRRRKKKNNDGANEDEIDADVTIKIPKELKTILPIILIVGVPILALMIFVTLFSEEQSSNIGTFALGTTCAQVTVTDTDCNSNAENCQYTYDGTYNFEDYIAGVVFAEVGSANNLDYYKIAAISARNVLLNHVDEDCTVKGNATFQAYKDVGDSPVSELIKQAVEETAGLVMIKNNKLANAYYASACVVNADDEYYYIRYGTATLGSVNFQTIPKDWDSTTPIYNGYLADWYSMTDKFDTNYETKSCPNNHDYGMSQLGAYYLITGENYAYEDVIKYYYGEDIEIKSIYTPIGETVNGFINPVNNFSCSNGYGCRLHPIYKYYQMHSGIDLAATSGETVYATKDGVISQVVTNVPGYSDEESYGNYVTIDHKDGSKTRYAHLLYGSIPEDLTVGTNVIQGEVIGQIGSTGASTGPHLHYELYINGQTTNPYDYLDLSSLNDTSRCNNNASIPMKNCGY